MSSSALAYKHTDLVELLQNAQRSVDSFIQCHDPLEPTLRECGLSSLSDPLTSLYSTSVKIQAPMVRCSRPAFRKLCRLWGTDVSYTHMIMAESFTHSSLARDADFALYSGEDRLVVQLASPGGPAAAAAAALLQPYCDAIDINCGCPQKWAMQEGIGAAMLEKPEVVADMIKCIRNVETLEGRPVLPCVVKMRVKEDIRQSIEFARQCVAAGASWITVHGRTPQDASSAPMRYDRIRSIRDALPSAVPLVANGSVTSPASALYAALSARSAGVMAGGGLLDNPMAFDLPAAAAEPLTFLPCPYDPIFGPSVLYRPSCASSGQVPPTPVEHGESSPFHSPAFIGPLPTPLEVISDFIRLAVDTDLHCTATVHHLLRMARDYLSPTERSYIASLRTNLAVMVAMEECGLYTVAGRYRPMTTEEGHG